MSGPATPFERLLQHIVSGEAVSAGVTNRAPQQLGRRTQYLFDRLQLLAAGEALFYHDVNLEVGALVGHVVYYNPTTDQYERAIAAVAYNPTAGWFEIAPSSFVVGMVYSKTANDRGSILTVGALRDFDLVNTVDDPTIAGPHYLSMTTPGKLTQFKPPVSVFTLYNRGDGSFHFYPTPRDVLEDHVHYRYHLFAQPAGDHNCIEITDDDVHRVLNPDANLPGWLPADHPSFAGVAPAGAKFGYNLAKHPELEAGWPPVPVDASYVERNGKGVPSNGAVRPTVLVDANGLWWFDNCYGAAPWAPAHPDCVEDSSSSPESSLSSSSGVQWDCLTPPEYMPGQDEQGFDQMVLLLWFTKMVFKTDDTVVTSLDPCSETEPISVLDCDGEPGSTGKLCLAFDCRSCRKSTHRRDSRASRIWHRPRSFVGRSLPASSLVCVPRLPASVLRMRTGRMMKIRDSTTAICRLDCRACRMSRKDSSISWRSTTSARNTMISRSCSTSTSRPVGSRASVGGSTFRAST